MRLTAEKILCCFLFCLYQGSLTLLHSFFVSVTHSISLLLSLSTPTLTQHPLLQTHHTHVNTASSKHTTHTSTLTNTEHPLLPTHHTQHTCQCASATFLGLLTQG